MQVSRRGPAFSVVMHPKKVSVSMHLKKASAGGPPKRRLPAGAFEGSAEPEVQITGVFNM